MTHTCSELSLRILLWNASYVQTLPLRLTGRGRWSDPTKYQGTTVAIAGAENDQIESWPFPFLVQKILSKKSRLRQTCKPWNESVGERALGLAGLAPCHSSKNNLQVRHGDQPWYPRVLWPLRWTIAHSTWMVPLQTYKVIEVKTYNREPEAQQVRSFTSLQMVHTHTPRCRMVFLEDAQPDTDQSSRSKCQLSAINDCLQRGKKHDLCAAVMVTCPGFPKTQHDVEQERSPGSPGVQPGWRDHHCSKPQNSKVAGLTQPVIRAQGR